MRTRVKICGITRIEDALAAAQAGADAIGLVFHKDSPRFVEPEQARAIARAVPPFVAVVGLFVDAPDAFIREVMSKVHLDVLQFHGDETPAQCRAPGRRYIKAMRMRPDLDARAHARIYADACGVLFDTYTPDVHGGSGRTFDWTRVPRGLEMPVILAGGLTPDNVAEAIAAVRPYAVDVSGGVEARKGIKDAARMTAFIDVVRGTA